MTSANLESVALRIEENDIGDVAIWDLVGFGLLVLACFFNLVSLEAGKDEIKLDGQVYVKLAITAGCFFYGLVGFLIDSRVRQVSLRFPAAWILVIFFLCVLASFAAIEPAHAMVSSFSILSVYLMTVTAVSSIGRWTALKAVFWGAGLFVMGSWLVYFLVPELGVMQEPIEGGEFVARLGGLSHPNTLGQCAGACCIVGSVLWISYQHRRWFVLGIICISALALAMCYSRTAIAAAVLSLAIAYRQILFRKVNPRWLPMVAAVGIGAVMVASLYVDVSQSATDRYLSLFSKSGDAEEITSATGRLDIWAKSIQLIGEKPALGYGPTSSKFLLEDYSLYAHNLWLNVGLSCGIGGLLVSIIMCGTRIWMFFKRCSPAADGLAAFIILNGLFENIIFSNLCGLPTICWVLALSWFRFEEDVA